MVGMGKAGMFQLSPKSGCGEKDKGTSPRGHEAFGSSCLFVAPRLRLGHGGDGTLYKYQYQIFIRLQRCRGARISAQNTLAKTIVGRCAAVEVRKMHAPKTISAAARP